jgi:hypothetical protein
MDHDRVAPKKLNRQGGFCSVLPKCPKWATFAKLNHYSTNVSTYTHFSTENIYYCSGKRAKVAAAMDKSYSEVIQI